MQMNLYVASITKWGSRFCGQKRKAAGNSLEERKWRISTPTKPMGDPIDFQELSKILMSKKLPQMSNSSS